MKKQSKPNQANKRRYSVRFWVLLAGGGLLVVSVWLAVAAHFSWGNHRAEAEQRYETAIDQTADTLAGDDLTIEDLEQLSVILQQTSERLCQHGGLSQIYRQIVPSASQAHQQCQAKADKLAEVADANTEVVEVIKSDKAMADILIQTTAKADKLQPDQFANLKKVWTQANQEIIDLQVAQQLEPTKKALVSAVSKITKSYNALAKADKAEKRIDFDKATTNLKNAYAELHDTKKQSESASVDSIKSFVDIVATP